MANKINIKSLYYGQLEKFIRELGLPKFKAKIIWQWIYKKQITDFESMSNLSKTDRDMLDKQAYISSNKIVQKQVSKKDGVIKYLFGLEDGKKIETVFIPGRNHNTLCISSQVGCPQSCTFCATASMGFVRNLEAHEIVEQILAVMRDGKEVNYVVFMGMGEPLLNYKNVVGAIGIINSKEGLHIGARKITVSTSGIAPEIKKLADEEVGVNLAISLNSSSNHKRSELMPINEKYPIMKLMDAAKYYQEQNGRRISFEYVLLDGVNDSDADANGLVKLMKRLISHVNLIQYNVNSSAAKNYGKSQRVDEFKAILEDNTIEVSLRKSAGPDIAAACGQLAG